MWRRGAAKKVVTYDEAQADYGLESEEDEVYYPANAAAPRMSTSTSALTLVIEGNSDEIDLVLSHSRHEDRLNDPKDVPQENLRFHIKWKGYSHIHNTDEVYSFLKSFKGFKKVDNYIAKVWLVDQKFRHPEPDAPWKPTQEESEQYEIDTERNKELLESYKVVERILDEKEEQRDEGVVSLFFCKWTSELRDMSFAHPRSAICRLHLGGLRRHQGWSAGCHRGLSHAPATRHGAGSLHSLRHTRSSYIPQDQRRPALPCMRRCFETFPIDWLELARLRLEQGREWYSRRRGQSINLEIS